MGKLREPVIAPEIKFLDMIGYSYVKVNSNEWNNEWEIYNKENEKVGFLIKVRSNRPDNKEYIMKIEDFPLLYITCCKLNSNSICYEFVVYQNFQTYNVKICVGGNPSIEVRDNENNQIYNFYITETKMHLEFISQTRKNNVEEIIELSRFKGILEYDYWLQYNSKHCNKVSKRELVVKTQKEKELYLREIYSKDNQVTERKENIVEGKLEDAIVISETGIKSFEFFREFINELLPFEHEVIATLLDGNSLPLKEMYLFMPDLVKGKAKGLNDKN